MNPVTLFGNEASKSIMKGLARVPRAKRAAVLQTVLAQMHPELHALVSDRVEQGMKGHTALATALGTHFHAQLSEVGDAVLNGFDDSEDAVLGADPKPGYHGDPSVTVQDWTDTTNLAIELLGTGTYDHFKLGPKYQAMYDAKKNDKNVREGKSSFWQTTLRVGDTGSSDTRTRQTITDKSDEVHLFYNEAKQTLRVQAGHTTNYAKVILNDVKNIACKAARLTSQAPHTGDPRAEAVQAGAEAVKNLCGSGANPIVPVPTPAEDTTGVKPIYLIAGVGAVLGLAMLLKRKRR